MIQPFTFDISMHDILNPPEGNRGSNIKLTFKRTKDAISFVPVSNNNMESVFSTRVSNPLDFGLINKEETTLKRFTDDLILAFNLVLKRGCITRNETRQHPVRFEYQERNKSTSYVVKTEHKTNVYLFESVGEGGDKVNALVTTYDDIDETEVLEIFEKVIQLTRHEVNNDFRETNLSLCLKNYENAMDELKISFKYRSLFNSLEFIINVSGSDLMGNRFDCEVNRLTGIPVSEVEHWRQFNDRLKHAQRKKEDIRKLIKGNVQFTSWMLSLRECTKQLIKSQIV
jgi:hypothetical protein